MESTEYIKGYKVFDKNWRCRGFQFSCPGIFEENITPKVCDRGFHFCRHLIDCFDYYPFSPKNHVAEIIATGDIETNGNKSCTNKIEIVRELSWHEVLDLVNTGKNCTGNRNSGDCNSGDRNSGNCNSGHCNSGDRNSGDYNSGNCNTANRNSGNCNRGDRNSGNHNNGSWNSGDCNKGYWNCGAWNNGNRNSGDCNKGNWNSGSWNSGSWNSGSWNKTNFSNGCFNTSEPKIYLFNKPSKWTYTDWLNSKAHSLLERMDLRIFDWIAFETMTDEEKTAHPEAKTTGGYLKNLDHSTCATAWWHSLSQEEKKVITTIPNFDKKIFKEITGIDI